jgi:membrane peptidoglycan carboxypeptidase
MKKILIIVLAFIAISILLVVLWFYFALRSLPDVSVLKHYRPAAATEVLDKDGNILTHYYERKFRVWMPISAMPDLVIRAVITAEDDTFFEHGAVNYKATWDALVRDVEKRRFARGGSTITQQMIKNVLLSREKTITRKLREYVLARKAEQILSKRRILEIYLNEVEWGDDIYGIEAASRYYLDKHSSELTPSEAALLAGMLPNPHYYNPYKRMGKARHRQEQILFNMHQAKLLTDEEYNAALAAPIQLRQEGKGRFDFPALSGQNRRPCYQVALEQILLSFYGDQALYRGGLTIRTTLDKPLQEELSHRVDESREAGIGESGNISVVKQAGVVRAILCAESKESEILSHFEVPGMPFSGYEVNILPADSLVREQIILLSAATGTAGLYH